MAEAEQEHGAEGSAEGAEVDIAAGPGVGLIAPTVNVRYHDWWMERAVIERIVQESIPDPNAWRRMILITGV